MGGLVLALSSLALVTMLNKRAEIQNISPTPAQAEYDEFADYHEVSEIPPFHIGETITCEDREIVITGFREDSNGNFLITGTKIVRAKVKQ